MAIQQRSGEKVHLSATLTVSLSHVHIPTRVIPSLEDAEEDNEEEVDLDH